MCKPGERPLPDPATVGAMKALKAAYDRKVVPSEQRYLYSAFDTPPLREQEFFGKPTILLLGQYSVGKTSMISYLLNGNYPGADIGPEPTTDVFAHVDFSDNTQTISGVTLASDNTYQFQSLSMFGDVFLNKLRATRFNAPLLKHISIIDTPGILTGDKQVASRGYDFAQVIKFLSNKVDCIFLLFDANKLDISDEYKQVIQILEGNEDKIKIILNKADWVKPRELVHVRGALMWALGKIMRCPEVPKVFIGSFWPYWSDKNVLLRDAIKEDLDSVVKEIIDLPNSYHQKRVNDVVRRARMLRIHSYIMDEIVRRKLFFTNTPTAVDTETKPQKLRAMYRDLALKRRIVMNDFPDPETFHQKAKKTEAKDWKRIDNNLEKLLNSFIDTDVSPIINATLTEEKIIIEYKLPKKVSLPEDYNKLIKNKKLAQFLPPGTKSESTKSVEKKLQKKQEEGSKKSSTEKKEEGSKKSEKEKKEERSKKSTKEKKEDSKKSGREKAKAKPGSRRKKSKRSKTKNKRSRSKKEKEDDENDDEKDDGDEKDSTDSKQKSKRESKKKESENAKKESASNKKKKDSQKSGGSGDATDSKKKKQPKNSENEDDESGDAINQKEVADAFS